MNGVSGYERRVAPEDAPTKELALNEEPTASRNTPLEASETLKPWIEPSLLKLEAGQAETGSLYGADGTAHS